MHTSQSEYLEVSEAAKLCSTRTTLPHMSEGKIEARWVPSHIGVHGNVLADLEAKRGAAMPPPIHNKSTRQTYSGSGTQLR